MKAIPFFVRVRHPYLVWERSNVAPFNGLFNVPIIILHGVGQGPSIPVLRMTRGVVVKPRNEQIATNGLEITLPSLSIPISIRGPTIVSYWGYILRHATEHPSEANIGESYIQFSGQKRSYGDFELETLLIIHVIKGEHERLLTVSNEARYGACILISNAHCPSC